MKGRKETRQGRGHRRAEQGGPPNRGQLYLQMRAGLHGSLWCTRTCSSGHAKRLREVEHRRRRRVAAVHLARIDEAVPAVVGDDGRGDPRLDAESGDELAELWEEGVDRVGLARVEHAPRHASVLGVPCTVELCGADLVQVEDGLVEAGGASSVVGHAVADGLDDRLALRNDILVDGVGAMVLCLRKDAAALLEQPRFVLSQDALSVDWGRNLVPSLEHLGDEFC